MNKRDERISRVKENLMRKYNCAQAVACTYAPMFGVDELSAFKGMEAFGGGMAIRSTCGAVSAMAYIAGLAKSDGNLEHPSSKQDTYNVLRPMIDDFIAENKSINCREIKGMDTGVVLASCPDCMRVAAEIIERHLIEDDDEQ